MTVMGVEGGAGGGGGGCECAPQKEIERKVGVGGQVEFMLRRYQGLKLSVDSICH